MFVIDLWPQHVRHLFLVEYLLTNFAAQFVWLQKILEFARLI
jgi:hypothetical protein